MTTTVHQNTEVRQSQIVDAAMALIVKLGSEHVTVKRIAGEVGITEAAVYRHFRSKSDILSLLIDHVKSGLLEDIQKGRANGKDSSTLGVVDRTLRTHLSGVAQRKGISFQVIAEIVSLGDPALNRKTSEAIRQYIASIRDLLCEGVKAGEIKDNIDLEATATILFSMIHGLVSIWTLSNRDFQLREKYESLWKVFKEAILVR
ncbi:MAG: TetR/AcrR family transcriptional regulator [Chloroflexi bacterium]|nr:TetR/AcrR family transcriptional regulator [Chloroflexota bacterium]